MKCCLYLRVSTGIQETENQLPDCMNYIQSHGWTLLETYSENESAWKQGHQVELSRLLDDIRSGKRHYDVVLCWALDRLSRQGPAAILNLVNSLALYKVKVVSIKESWTDTPSELTPLLLAITGWIAEQESKRRSERTLAGLARARSEGKPIGKRGKDKKQRRRAGYLARYMQKEVRQAANV